MVITGWHLAQWVLAAVMCVIALWTKDGNAILASYLTLAYAIPSFSEAARNNAKIRLFGKDQ